MPRHTAYNGPYALLGCTFMPKVGAHDGDWERLTVRLGAPDFQLQARLVCCCAVQLYSGTALFSCIQGQSAQEDLVQIKALPAGGVVQCPQAKGWHLGAR